jgi:hypothetical protein
MPLIARSADLAGAGRNARSMPMSGHFADVAASGLLLRELIVSRTHPEYAIEETVYESDCGLCGAVPLEHPLGESADCHRDEFGILLGVARDRVVCALRSSELIRDDHDQSSWCGEGFLRGDALAGDGRPAECTEHESFLSALIVKWK